jgi:uncharacterized protein YjbI with pentapeptide repeats
MSSKVPSIPAVTEDNLVSVARAVKSILDVREGRVGNVLDSYITYRDLITSGIAKEAFGLSGGSASPIISAGLPADGYDPTTDLTPPPAPSTFTQSSGITAIQLQWADWGYRNHAYTEIWRHTSNVLGSATLIGTSDTNFYSDSVGATSKTYYYWIRFVSQANVTGPYQATSGLSSSTGLIAGVDLSDLIITAAKLATDAVESGKIKDAAVTTTKIANLAVGNAAIANGAITNAKIGDAAVDTAKISDAAITTAKIGSLAVTTAKIADANITSAKIADANITTAKIADANITAAKIADANITSAKIADGNITNAKIADAAITNAKIANASITAAKIVDGEITNAKIGNVIQSSNFSSGSSGWQIEKGGSAEFSNVTIRNRNFQVASGTLSVATSQTYINFDAPTTLNGDTYYFVGTYYIDTGFSVEPWGAATEVYSLVAGIAPVVTAWGSNFGTEYIWFAVTVNRLFTQWRWNSGPVMFAEVQLYVRRFGDVFAFSIGGIPWKLHRVT